MTSPISYGYGEELGVHFSNGPVLSTAPPPRRFPSSSTVPRGTDGGPGSTTSRASGRGGLDEANTIQGRSKTMGNAAVDAFLKTGTPRTPWGERYADPPEYGHRVILRFSEQPETLLISGGLKHGEEMAGAPALVDVPVGEGHVVLFGFDPFHRGISSGSYALVFNAMLHYDHLDASDEEASTDSP